MDPALKGGVPATVAPSEMILDQLKQHTRQQHEKLERLNGLPFTRSDYLAQLESFFGFVVPWEQRAAAALGADHPWLAGRLKTAWLEADLQHFGYTPAQIAALPRCTDLPRTDNEQALLGTLYVLEGSTLGGQFITRHLTETLGLTGGGGYRYFRSYGSEVGAKWQAFRQELLRQSSPANDPAILASAADTFEKLHAWFAERREAVA